MTTKTPVAVFIYNRPDNTRHMLDTLAQCHRLDECDIFIYCDGARETSHTEGVESARKVARDWVQQHAATLIERTENLGLGRSIVSGVTDLCERYGQVIVIEDDLLLAPDFIDFMLQGLVRYRDVPQVMQIGGFVFPVAQQIREPFFLPLTTTWGWATWQRAWTLFQWRPAGTAAFLADSAKRQHFDLNGSYPYSELLEKTLSRNNPLWGIRWYYQVYHANGLTLYPPVSLVMNDGFDGSGVHSSVWENPNSDLTPELIRTVHLVRPLVLPDDIRSNNEILNQIALYLKAWYYNQPQRRAQPMSWRQSLKRFLRLIWQGTF